MNIEITKEMIVNNSMGAIVGLLFTAIAAWGWKKFKDERKKFKGEIKKLEKDITTLRKDLDTSKKEVSVLKKEIYKSVESVNAIKHDTIIIADKIGLKGDLLFWGRSKFSEGRFTEAAEILTELIKKEPRNDVAHFERGRCYLSMGHKFLGKARDDLELAVSAKKEDPERHLELSTAYLRLKMPKKAATEAQAAIDHGSSDELKPRLNIAKAHKLEKDWDSAIGVLNKCPRTQTSVVLLKGEALIEKARAAPTEKKRLYTDTIDHYKDAITRNSLVSKYYTYRALAYAERNEPGDWDKALKDWEDAIEKAKIDPRPWELRADALYQRAIILPRNSQRDQIFNEAIKDYGAAMSHEYRGFHRCFIVNKQSLACQYVGKFDFALSETRSNATKNPAHITNFMAWATAAISAYDWNSAIEAAGSGLETKEAKAQEGTIWCLLFRIIGRCGTHQRTDMDKILKDCRDLSDELNKFSTFNSAAWDWIIAKERLGEAMKNWPDDFVSIIQDSIALVEKRISQFEYKQKHFNSR